MKLSVIIPAYKFSAYIHECLLSVLAQKTNFEFEVLVCNDCSPDNTREVIRYLENSYSRLKVLDSAQNMGLVGSMRKLLQAAKGQYIAYLDGDDVALPGKLQAQVDYLDQNSDCAISYHESDMFDTISGARLKLYSQGFYNAAQIPARANITHLIQFGTFLQASSIMFRQHPAMLDALEHGCNIICDYPWHIMNAGYLQGSVDFLPAVLGRYRVHPNSFCAMTQQSAQRRLQVTEELIKACRLGERFGVEERIVQRGVNHQYFAAALFFLKNHEDALFLQMIEKSATVPLWFDDRHRLAHESRHDMDAVRHIVNISG
jgi:glycosyltransferase involved in cell wall biosynthesis